MVTKAFLILSDFKSRRAIYCCFCFDCRDIGLGGSIAIHGYQFCGFTQPNEPETVTECNK